MRILLLSDDPGDARMGASKAALKLRAALAGMGHECDTMFREQLPGRPRGRRLRLAAGPWLAWRAVARARRNGIDYDVIDAAGAEALLLAALRRCGRLPRTRVVARSHGLESLEYRQLLRDHEAGLLRKPRRRRLLFPLLRLPQLAAALRLADGAILLNRREQAHLTTAGRVPLARTAVVPLGVDAAWWRDAPGPEAARGAGILFCGSWYAAKGVHYLAEAHRLLCEQGLRIPLTVLGPFPDLPSAAAGRARVAAALAPASRPLLTVLERAPEAAVFAQYRRHDLLVCPSTSEGFGLAVIEALSQRLPVVCSLAAGAAELLRDGEEALLVAPRDAAALAAAIARLWEDGALRRRLAEAGRQRVRALTWERAAELTLAAYAGFPAERGGFHWARARERGGPA